MSYIHSVKMLLRNHSNWDTPLEYFPRESLRAIISSLRPPWVKKSMNSGKKRFLQALLYFFQSEVR